MSRPKTAIQTMRDPFKQFVVISTVAHVIVGLSFVLKAAFFPSEAIDIRSAIRIDVVGLPDKIEDPKPKPAAKPQKVKVPQKTPSKPKPKKRALPKPEKPKVNLKKTKSNQEKALERLKALEAIEQMERDAKQTEIKEEIAPQEFKGNTLNSGTSLTGLDRIAFERYFSEMEEHVRHHWNLPAWLANSDFKGVVGVRIDERGYVVDRAIVAPSGNEIFDNLVLETVDKASPFPAPPARLKNVLELKGFQIGFPE